MGFPLMVRAIRLSIEAVDPKLEEAASSLGASPVRVFLTVTLPLALPGVLAGLVLAFAKALGEFGATITFVSNIPGQTRTLPSAIYAFLQVPGGESAALRLVMVSVVLAMGALALSEILARRMAKRGGGHMSISVQVRHRFDGFTLDARFEVPPGLTALFGRSGSGKSTVIRAVAGLFAPDMARVEVDGRVLCDTQAGIFLPPHKRRIGTIFQDARLFPHLNVRQNLDYGRRFSGREVPDSEVAHMVEMLGIGHLLMRRPVGLSGGEQQRVAIGRALLSGPDLILADEPLAALDEARKRGDFALFRTASG